MALHNEPLSNFKLYHISFFGDDIWLSFMSDKIEKRQDEFTGRVNDWGAKSPHKIRGIKNEKIK